MNLRPATKADEDAIWSVFHAVIATGDTLVFDPDMPRDEALACWFHSDTHTYVAENQGRIVGTYILKANQPGLGSHVANAGFMVSPSARGLGVGRRMGEHCLDEARRLGFRAMQFNIVVSTNEPAVRLWQQLGFTIVGTLPGVFRHSQRGFVDAHVMFRTLETAASPCVVGNNSGLSQPVRQTAPTGPELHSQRTLRFLAIAEVLGAFVLVHLTYRTLMHFTVLGSLDRAAGTNLIPGIVMIGFTVALVLAGRRDFRAYGLSFRGIDWRWVLALFVAPLLLFLSFASHCQQPLGQALLTSLSLIVGAGIGEEFFFRGYIQSRLNAAFGRPFRFGGMAFGVGLVLSAVLFGFLHTLNTVDYFHGRFTFAWGSGLVTLGSGLVFACLREATGSTAAPALAHCAIDLLARIPRLTA